MHSEDVVGWGKEEVSSEEGSSKEGSSKETETESGEEVMGGIGGMDEEEEEEDVQPFIRRRRIDMFPPAAPVLVIVAQVSLNPQPSQPSGVQILVPLHQHQALLAALQSSV